MKRVVRATAYLVMPDPRYGTVWGVCICIYYHTERRIMRECLWQGGTVRGMRFFGLPPTRTWELHNKQTTMTNTPPPCLAFFCASACRRAVRGQPWVGAGAGPREGRARGARKRVEDDASHSICHSVYAIASWVELCVLHVCLTASPDRCSTRCGGLTVELSR